MSVRTKTGDQPGLAWSCRMASMSLHGWPSPSAGPYHSERHPALGSALAKCPLWWGWCSELQMPVITEVYFGEANCLFSAGISPTLSHYAHWCPQSRLVWFIPFQRRGISVSWISLSSLYPCSFFSSSSFLFFSFVSSSFSSFSPFPTSSSFSSGEGIVRI